MQGDIARQLDIPPTNLSFHLKALVQSGLVHVAREGRYMRCAAAIPLMLETIAYLTEKCCTSKPECCRQFREASTVPATLLPRLDD